MNHSRWYFTIASGLIIIDQLLKFLVKGGTVFGIHREGMYLGQSIPLIGEAGLWHQLG
jgi:lipoprotein signal peptidase